MPSLSLSEREREREREREMAAFSARNAFAHTYCQPFRDATQLRASPGTSFSQHKLLAFSRSKRCIESASYVRSATPSSHNSIPKLSKANEGLLTEHSLADLYPLNELPVVKMCGITNPSDAAIAAEAGATYIGMILYPKSKRSVSLDVAKQIAMVSREGGAEPVGVFVDEDATTIRAWCDAAGLSVVQLHGDVARAALLCLPTSLKVIYVLHADKHGILQTRVPAKQECSSIDWILIDGLQGGSGSQFDWTTFQPPLVNSRHGWLLAGGLKPENVATAISTLKPDGVDVSSGIADQDGLSKDHIRIGAFMDAVRHCKNLYTL